MNMLSAQPLYRLCVAVQQSACFSRLCQVTHFAAALTLLSFKRAFSLQRSVSAHISELPAACGIAASQASMAACSKAPLRKTVTRVLR